jgi:hypothetical protein
MAKIRSLEELESEWSEMESEWESLKSQMMKKKVDKPKEETKFEFLIPSDESSSESEEEEKYQKPVSSIPFETKYEEVLRDYKAYEIGQDLSFISQNTYICAYYNGYYGYQYSLEQIFWPRKGFLKEVEDEDGYRVFVIKSTRGYKWELNEKNYDIFYREGRPEGKSKLRRELESICYGKNIRIRKRKVPLDLVGKKKSMEKFMEKLENEENQDLYEKIDSESDIGEEESDPE